MISLKTALNGGHFLVTSLEDRPKARSTLTDEDKASGNSSSCVTKEETSQQKLVQFCIAHAHSPSATEHIRSNV